MIRTVPTLTYTQHSLDRMESRGITREQVELAIALGEAIPDPKGNGAEVFLVTTPVAYSVPGLRDLGGMRVVVADRHRGHPRVVTVMFSFGRAHKARSLKLKHNGIKGPARSERRLHGFNRRRPKAG